MKRREFIALVGGGAVTWPIAASGQQDRVRRVGVLMPFAASDVEAQARITAFREELQKLGWSEGGNLQIIDRWATDNMDRVRAAAVELVNMKPDVILTQGGRVVPILQKETHTIPIVFAGISDPLGAGIVTSLARPDSNTTGFSLLEFSVIGKMLRH
jgi:putative ABC transport system substrate-binding protein